MNSVPVINGTNKKTDSTYGLFIDRSGLISADRLESAGWPFAEIQFSENHEGEEKTYRAQIAAEDAATYCDRFNRASDEMLLADWTQQIQRNAEIARDKYMRVRRSMCWSFLAALPWIASSGMLVKR